MRLDQALDSGSHASVVVKDEYCSSRGQGESREELRRVDQWKAGIAFLAGLCARTQSRRIGAELLYMKRTGGARNPLRKGDSLHDRIDEQLLQIKWNPALVRSFFKAEDVSYISD